MDHLAYGVFRLGQIWSVVSGDGTRVGFTSREDAVAAAHALAARGRDEGGAEIAVQDELGLLTTVRFARG